jgi:TetR/AcrR family transcriptional repressor of nem operon
MKVSREKAAAHRLAILKAASHLFRKRGLDDVGVVEIMQAAGLTHGGFYGHFASKDALAVEACAAAFAEGCDRVARDADPEAYVARYLSPRHRDRVDGGGCPMAALGAEIDRQDEALQESFSQGVTTYLDAVTQLFQRSGGIDAAASRQEAIATLSTLIGGMILARATAMAEPTLSAEILATLPGALMHRVAES